MKKMYDILTGVSLNHKEEKYIMLSEGEWKDLWTITLSKTI